MAKSLGFWCVFFLVFLVSLPFLTLCSPCLAIKPSRNRQPIVPSDTSEALERRLYDPCTTSCIGCWGRRKVPLAENPALSTGLCVKAAVRQNTVLRVTYHFVFDRTTGGGSGASGIGWQLRHDIRKKFWRLAMHANLYDLLQAYRIHFYSSGFSSVFALACCRSFNQWLLATAPTPFHPSPPHPL